MRLVQSYRDIKKILNAYDYNTLDIGIAYEEYREEWLFRANEFERFIDIVESTQ